MRFTLDKLNNKDILKYQNLFYQKNIVIDKLKEINFNFSDIKDRINNLAKFIQDEFELRNNIIYNFPIQYQEYLKLLQTNSSSDLLYKKFYNFKNLFKYYTVLSDEYLYEMKNKIPYTVFNLNPNFILNNTYQKARTHTDFQFCLNEYCIINQLVECNKSTTRSETGVENFDFSSIPYEIKLSKGLFKEICDNQENLVFYIFNEPNFKNTYFKRCEDRIFPKISILIENLIFFDLYIYNNNESDGSYFIRKSKKNADFKVKNVKLIDQNFETIESLKNIIDEDEDALKKLLIKQIDIFIYDDGVSEPDYYDEGTPISKLYSGDYKNLFDLNYIVYGAFSVKLNINEFIKKLYGYNKFITGNECIIKIFFDQCNDYFLNNSEILMTNLNDLFKDKLFNITPHKNKDRSTINDVFYKNYIFNMVNNDVIFGNNLYNPTF